MRPELVAVADTGATRYPEAPYHPGEAYPEMAWTDRAERPNPVYAGVRELLASLGLDQARYGTRQWNPLGEFIRPGDRVLIKPNLVRHYHPYGLDPESLVTHASLIRAVCDYVLVAGGPRTRLVIADAPLQSCDFDAVTALSGLDRLARHYRRCGADVELRDLRLVRAIVDRASVYGNVLVQMENPGDPRGYTAIDLGRDSAHAAAQGDTGRYRVTCYDPARMRRHHGAGRHEYVIANTLLEADVVINLPKMKTHHKAGITAGLKNFIGINGHKDCLPHHTKGTPEEGGDEFRRSGWVKRTDSWLMDAKEQGGGAVVKKAAAVAHRVLEAVHRREGYWEGSWYGNQTIARTTVDLNRIVQYAGRDGFLAAQRQRKVLTIVDGILAGEGDGPLAPTPRPVGLLVGGSDPVAVDMAVARLMGFRYGAVPTIRLALDGCGGFRLAAFDEPAARVVSRAPRWDGVGLGSGGDSLAFRAHEGWKGHIEL